MACIETQEEADAFLDVCKKWFNEEINPFVAFSKEELDRITRKNIVVHAIKFGPEVLKRAELLFKMKNPME